MARINLLDFNFPVRDPYETVDQVHARLRPWFKKYIFQKEKSENGYVHWQGRGSLIKKAVHDKIKGQLGFHNDPTTNEEFKKKSFQYVMKEQTRIDGPWDDRDYDEPAVMTRQLESFLQLPLRPYQQQIKDMITVPCDRSIIVIYDPIGNSGKSIFSEYLEYLKVAYEIPTFDKLEDIMFCVMGLKTYPCYIVDMPRGLPKRSLSQFYSGLECLKNGVAYDKRYQFRKRRFDRPHIVVFTNVLPKWNLLSLDRWKPYRMLSDYSMTPMTIKRTPVLPDVLPVLGVLRPL